MRFSAIHSETEEQIFFSEEQILYSTSGFRAFGFFFVVFMLLHCYKSYNKTQDKTFIGMKPL